jgi:hypothetical protein
MPAREKNRVQGAKFYDARRKARGKGEERKLKKRLIDA